MIIATVVDAGLATVQDGGRPGLSGIGVPGSGAWHRRRYRDAIRLVGAADDGTTPAIELLAGRLVLRGEAESTMAVVGPAQVLLDGHRAAAGSTFRVSGRTQVTVDHVGPGPVYVMVSGWEPPRVLGSAATDTFSGLGAPGLRPGTELEGTSSPGIGAGAFLRTAPLSQRPLRVLRLESGDADLEPAWLQGPWTTATSARSGTRLVGGVAPRMGSVPSTPVVVGAIQATPAGELIILGPDGALTGGYPILGVISSTDLPLVSELVVGEPAAFEPVDLDGAVRAFWQQESGSTVVRPDHVGQDGSIAGG